MVWCVCLLCWCRTFFFPVVVFAIDFLFSCACGVFRCSMLALVAWAERGQNGSTLGVVDKRESTLELCEFSGGFATFTPAMLQQYSRSAQFWKMKRRSGRSEQHLPRRDPKKVVSLTSFELLGNARRPKKYTSNSSSMLPCRDGFSVSANHHHHQHLPPSSFNGCCINRPP